MISVRKLSPAIGAEIIGVDLTQPVDEGTKRELQDLWLEHIVLLFRGRELSQQDLLSVTSIFGKVGQLARPKEFRPKGFADLLDNIMLISNIRENGIAIGSLPDGEMHFHHDTLHAEIPHKGTCLYAVEIPSVGGNTCFASGYAAYENMDAHLRDKLEGKRAFNHYNYGSVQRGDSNGVAAFAESSHPVFRTHEATGRKAVYVNRLMTVRIDGMAPEESEQALLEIFDFSEKPEWVYEHVWRRHDLLIWDNRCSMHARTDFPPGENRLMLRTTIEGETRPY